jgi:(1->4)-alpha-D-glucan 1-alpha-D-glucosylmutase
VVDPPGVRERGGARRGARWSRRAAARAGFVLDIVPNHVGVDGHGEPVVVGRAAARAGLGVRDVLRHRLVAGPILLPVLDADEEKALASSLSDDGPSCATTSTRSRWRPAPAAAPRRRCTSASTTGWSWKRGAAELTYRRFFDVSTLAAVRVEDPEVFEATHARCCAGSTRARWTACAWTTRTACPTRAATAPAARGDRAGPLAGGGEDPRRRRGAAASWPVDGTSGYEALREICGVFVDPDGAGCSPSSPPSTRAQGALHAAEHAARREVADRSWPPRCAGSPALARRVRRRRTADARGRRRAALRLPRLPLLPARGPRALDTAVSVARPHRPGPRDVLDALTRAMLADPRGELATRCSRPPAW